MGEIMPLVTEAAEIGRSWPGAGGVVGAVETGKSDSRSAPRWRLRRSSSLSGAEAIAELVDADVGAGAGAGALPGGASMDNSVLWCIERGGDGGFAGLRADRSLDCLALGTWAVWVAAGCAWGGCCAGPPIPLRRRVRASSSRCSSAEGWGCDAPPT